MNTQIQYCCLKLEVLSKYHDFMEITDNSKIRVLASSDDTFWGRHIKQEYFEFQFCPFCGTKL